MRQSIVRVMLVFWVWLCAISGAFAQSDYHQLTVDDFRGIPQTNSGNVVAHTKCTIDFKYYPVDGSDDYRLRFNVRLILQRERSWLDRRRIQSQKMLADVLKHEQGHYAIAFMEQQEVLREAARTRFTSNYNAEANALFNRIHAKYQNLNANYDEDTHNMQDGTQQHSWDVYFQKRLAYMPPADREGY